MTRRFTTADLENLTEGATPGPWRWYWDQGIMSLEGADNAPVATDLDVRDSDLLAAAPELAAEHHRIITALEGWRKEEQEVLATVDPTSLVDQLLIVAAQDNINWITRILEGDSNE